MRILLLIVSISVMLGCNTNKDNNSFIVLDYDEYNSYLFDSGQYLFDGRGRLMFDSTVDTIGYLFDRSLRDFRFRPIYKSRDYRYIMNTNDGAIYRMLKSHSVSIGCFIFDTLLYKFNDDLPSLTHSNQDERDVLVDSIIRANNTLINNDAEWELIVKPIN